MYYFIIETFQGTTTEERAEKKEIIKLYNQYLNSYNFLSLSKIYYKNN